VNQEAARLAGVSFRAGSIRWIVAALVGMATLAIPFAPSLSAYYLSLFMQAVTYAIAVLGMTVVLGFTGQINLAQAAFFGVGAYGMALGTTVFHLSVWWSLLAAMAASCVAGAILGFTTLRLGGHYLAMITISFQQIFSLILQNWVQVSGGPDGIRGIPRPSLAGFEFVSDRSYLALCLVALYIVGFFVWRLADMRLGRAMFAVRENELAAGVAGVNTYRVKVIAFILGALLGGIGGGLFASGFAYVSPDAFDFNASIVFLTMVLLGGSGSVFGACLGTGLLILLPEWLRFLKEIYLAVYGLAVILIMVFMPEGIWGFVTLLRRRFAPDRPAARYAGAQIRFAANQQADATLLELRGVHKHFGGLRAVDGIDLSVVRGHVHALIGPNGSGKTTLLNVLNGIYRPTAGQVIFDGRDMTAHASHEMAQGGVGRTFQNIRLFRALTVLENVMVGAQRPGNPFAEDDQRLRERAMEALAFVGLSHRAHDVVRDLPYGHQRLVEIARALAGAPDLILLDEPAAGLNATEKQELVQLLGRLRGHGLTMLLIDHDVSLVEQVADRITVLNFGKKIADGMAVEVLNHPDVITAYLGEPPASVAA
jgi:ABC-type branched-subunit amino acid transport system ATPase component/ABC-type branched-subunit amino acid transport system permease subunit